MVGLAGSDSHARAALRRQGLVDRLSCFGGVGVGDVHHLLLVQGGVDPLSFPGSSWHCGWVPAVHTHRRCCCLNGCCICVVPNHCFETVPE